MKERLFHLVTGEDIARFQRTAGSSWTPPSLASEGFVHLSYSKQLAGTLGLHFAAASEVLLVEVDRASVEEALKVEVSRGDEAFPHVYRALDTHEFLHWWLLERSSAGEWELPLFGSSAEQDRPQGSAHAPGPVG